MTAAVDLARRAVACRGWRWMPGMLSMSDPECVPRPHGAPAVPSPLRARVTSVCIGIWYGVGEYTVDDPDWEHESVGGNDLPGTLPDLDDPATLGCLLALVREAWGDPGLGVSAAYWDGAYHWRAVGGHHHGSAFRRVYAAEADALVAALEAAP